MWVVGFHHILRKVLIQILSSEWGNTPLLFVFILLLIVETFVIEASMFNRIVWWSSVGIGLLSNRHSSI